MQLFTIFPPGIQTSANAEDEPPTDIYTEELFKGFTLENDVLTMVYDATRVPVSLSSDKQYYWVTPYEIFISKIVAGMPIDDTVYHFFDTIHVFNGVSESNKKGFYHLKRLSDNKLVKSPYVLFMCKQNESKGLFSMFETSSEIKFENIEQKDSEETVSIIYPRIKHPKIGTFTFFSSLSIQKKVFPRYVVFVDLEDLSPLYLEPDEMDQLDHLYDAEQTKKYSCITFKTNETQIWCVKSPFYFSIFSDETYVENIEEPTVESSVESSVEPSAEPSVESSVESSVEPTVESSVESSAEPSVESSVEPSAEPSVESSVEPSVEPSAEESKEEPIKK
jgi:hypothetical protein